MSLEPRLVRVYSMLERLTHWFTTPLNSGSRSMLSTDGAETSQ